MHQLILLAERIAKSKSYYYICFAFLIGIIFLSIWLHRNQAVNHIEHYTTIPHFLSDRPLLNLIFDIEHTEAPPSRGNFQARELSYFFDYLDVQATGIAIRLGLAHGMSTVEYLMLVILTVSLWYFFTNSLRLGPTLSFLLIAVMLTSPAYFFEGIQHRTAKMGASLLLCFSFLWAYRVLHKNPAYRNVFVYLASVPIFLALTLMDMQGFYFVLVAFTMSLLYFFKNRNAKAKPLVAALLSAALLHLVYKVWLGAEIIEAVNGYAPTNDFQQPKFEPEYWDIHLQSSLLLLTDYLRFLFGGFSIEIFLPLAGLIALFTFVKNFSKDPLFKTSWMQKLMYALLFIFSLEFMIFLMIQKFPDLYREDLRRVYYPLPMELILIIGLAYLLKDRLAGSRRQYQIIHLVMGILLVGNIMALPQHEEMVKSYHTSTSSQPEAELRIEALRNLWNKSYALPAEVKQDPLYYFYRDYVIRSGALEDSK